jgi:hypothetical protein
MAENQSVLPLTDKNQLLVNQNLLNRVIYYKPKGMLGLYEKLDRSLKKDEEGSLLTYDGMRKAINRDLKSLSESADNPEKLHKWLNQRHKKNERLQIRITANQFLLNNILSILGIRYEDLFDRNQLPEHTEEPSADNNIPDRFEDPMENGMLLKEINSKLDEILRKYKDKKNRKNYLARYNDLFQCISFFNNIFISAFHNPKEKGFSLEMINGSEQKSSSGEIYKIDLFFIHYLMNNMISDNRWIKKSFIYFQENQDNYTLDLKRMVCSVFMIEILWQILIDFINRGIRSKKPIFRLIEKDFINFADYLDFMGVYDKAKADTEKVLKKIKEAQTKTHKIINFMLKKTIRPDVATCEKYEGICATIFVYVSDLFQFVLPDIKKMIDPSNIKNMEDNIGKLFTPGLYYKFNIKPEQLDFLEEYMDSIEEAQMGLKPFLRGNYDVVG